MSMDEPRPADEAAADAATADALRARIRAFVGQQAPDPLDLRGAARELDLLPLVRDHVTVDDRERWYGVRPDGQVLSFAAQPPRDPRPPESRWRQWWVLAQERERYPELDALIPPRPRGFPFCPICGGTGRTELGVSGEMVTCVCGGLGWIPPKDDPPGERRPGGAEGGGGEPRRPEAR